MLVSGRVFFLVAKGSQRGEMGKGLVEAVSWEIFLINSVCIRKLVSCQSVYRKFYELLKPKSIQAPMF